MNKTLSGVGIISNSATLTMKLHYSTSCKTKTNKQNTQGATLVLAVRLSSLRILQIFMNNPDLDSLLDVTMCRNNCVQQQFQ